MKNPRRVRRLSRTAYASLRLFVAVLVLAGCLSALSAFKMAVEAAAGSSSSSATMQPSNDATTTRPSATDEGQDADAQKIDKVLRRYDTLRLDAAQAAERVRKDGRLTLVTPTETLEIELEPNDLRAANYRAEESQDGGEVRALDSARPVRTFKGIVRGKEGAAARFTIDDSTVEGLVLIDGEKYFVETKSKYLKSAAPQEFLFYKESDVLETAPASCDATLDEKMKQAGEVVSLQSSRDSLAAAAAGTIPLNRDIKLATEADYEYVSAFGSSESANDEILSIMNLIEGVYQNELGLSFTIVYQHTWATTADPYQSSSPNFGLTEFENYWNANFTHIARDTAHLWTGKDLDGTVIGSAEIGSICLAPARAYGMSQRLFETDIKVGLTAHELGHNLGATHSDQDPSAGDCQNSIMQSFVGYSRSFCPYSRDQIAAYVGNNASCLAQTYAISGQITSEAFLSQMTLTLTGPKTRQFPISLGSNTGGFTIRGLTPGTYTVTVTGQFQNITPASRTVTIVNSDVTGVDFASTLVRFKVGGRLTDANNAPLAGISVSISTPAAFISETFSDANGNYSFEAPATRDYRVTPYSPNGYFEPVDATISTLTSDRLNLNFVGTIRTPPPTPTPTPTPTPISGLSGSIAFAGYDQFPYSNIYIADADGGANLSGLTSDDLESGTPAWSPDGQTLAFVRSRYVYLMNADGSGVRRLTNTHEFESFPAWSPDGSKLLVRKFSGYYIVSADGKTQTQLPAGGNEADWSPDGKKIVYAAGLYTANHIYVMNADGTNQTALTSGYAAYSSPHWSPDGQKILFVAPAPGGAQISLMNPDGSGVVALTPPGANLEPAWSPDGTKIVFNRGGDIYVMRSDGSNLTQVTSGARNDSNPTWRNAAAPPRSSFQFSAANYQAGEGDGRATIAVERVGTSVGAVSVDFSVVDDPAPVTCADTVNNHGAAYARCDYATVVETLTFAPGETRKTITIPLVDDAFTEGQETVRLRLSSPVGAVLGATTSSTLSIQDNDAGQGQNPIFSTPFFVRMQYLDFLSREPEAGEPWSAVLNNCPNVNNNPACDRILVSQSFFGSPEFRLKGFYVFAFYRLAFARLPQYDEIIADMRRVSGATAEEVYAKRADFAVNFTLRREFRNEYGGIDDAGYVMYLMNRYNLQQITTPDPANPDGAAKVVLTRTDLFYALGANHSRTQTLSRAQVLRAIAQSDEVAAAEYNAAFVAMQYYGYLRRTPEDGGYQAWLRVINQDPNNIRIMVNGFMNSPEYRLRFGQ
ncbi:MAG TPA: M12 family metallo-peptidase [Pyrinomonadaceae bacterium]|nr:M12 family metallo-peptidase [Pyrinomonadaceae bacterium]